MVYGPESLCESVEVPDLATRMGSDHVAMAICVIPKAANELPVLTRQVRNVVSLCTHWRGPSGTRLAVND